MDVQGRQDRATSEQLTAVIMRSGGAGLSTCMHLVSRETDVSELISNVYFGKLYLIDDVHSSVINLGCLM